MTRALALLGALLAATPATAGSIRDCRLVQKPDGWFAGGEYAAAIADGYLRMLLIRRSDGPSTAMDFTPWKDGSSVHSELRTGGNAGGEFWLATARPDGRVAIERWHVGGDDADRTSFVFTCPQDQPAR
jgi:hypothetical protein